MAFFKKETGVSGTKQGGLVMKCRMGLILGFAMLQSVGFAAIVVPGADGSDGILHVPSNTTMVIDLSQAVSADWDADNTANAGSGVYDSNKWAVVFKYSSVTIDPGATLTFSNHPSRAPVVWLVDGDITIDGTVELSGANYVSAPAIAEPGPGGFRGGMGYYTSQVGASAGFGPGGGHTQVTDRGYGASHANTVTESPDAYGNPSLVPLLGGSGGGGAKTAKGGGAGGGAILMACSGTLTLNSSIKANGGNGMDVGYTTSGDSGGGSGGGIRLVADTFAGNGLVEAKGGIGGSYPGALGRVRLERVNNNDTWTAIAPDPSVVELADGDTALLWPTATSPTVKVLSIGSEAVPGDPRASFGTVGADVALAQTNTTQVLIETSYVEQASVVTVRVTPRSNASYTEVAASVSEVVSTDPLVVRWVADIPVNTGYSAIQVHVVRP
jgi:plastocyanin